MTRKKSASPRKRYRKGQSFQKLSLDGVEALGGKVECELDERRTVLVGLNGSGKSLFLETVWSEARAACTVQGDVPREERTFSCDIVVRDADRITYAITRGPARKNSQSRLPGLRRHTTVSIQESCVLHRARDHELWRVEDGELRVRGKLSGRFVGGGLLTAPTTIPLDVMDSVELRSAFLRMAWVYPGLPRSNDRNEELVAIDDDQPDAEPGNRVATLNATLVRWGLEAPSLLELMDAAMQRVGIGEELTTEVLSSKARGTDWGQAQVDGVNLGLLADGTLRVLEILAAILDPDEDGLLLVEEPESGIHPGLLHRLLAEMDAATTERQIVISTHSPQVVSWARPAQLRLVERERGRTRIRSLKSKQVANIEQYLREAGTLGDYVFGGGLDD